MHLDQDVLNWLSGRVKAVAALDTVAAVDYRWDRTTTVTITNAGKNVVVAHVTVTSEDES